ncbi:HupE / UreJ protein [Geodermatophilus amargosae]|uniref:HupE / UreJ protein n=1 Tax=Geodermatophilus amargosae TaxID=1296565 RepID=A0A1I7D457_9ACTN|nr:HupE/UreJ family protein [Geodermatophilus amargosae]SFU06411.1 HupE / UreJ protein [Geodermatophilus amargosae]
MTPLLRRRTSAGAALTGGLTSALVLLTPATADAHSLDSSTLSVRMGEDSVDATVSVALETLDAALGTAYTSSSDVDSYAEAVTAYLDEHLTVTGADGTAWTETYTDVVRQSVEGIESLSVEVTLDPGNADPAAFTVTYDGIIEADPSHEAVVVLTDAAGDISTAGVLTASDGSLQIGEAAGGGISTGLPDMVGHGLHHVLEGADHLLFLLTLLLVAPLAVTAGRWQRRVGLAATLRRVLAVVTAFTVGHSLTLIASALGWVSVPGAPVEVAIAASVGVAAVHAMRPLARRGEVLIAAGFGLVHGLAFAGILTDLGLDGSASVSALLAFNVGVELAQLLTVALVFPSLYVVSRTRWYPALRRTGAVLALTAATGWALDRLGILANPLAGAEEAVIAHPGYVVAALALLAASCWADERRRPTRPTEPTLQPTPIPSAF